MLKHYTLLFALAALLNGCNTSTPKTVETVVVHDTLVIVSRDTVVVKSADTIVPVSETPKKEQVKVEPNKKAVAAVAPTDTTFYYYPNGSVSVKITPWKDGNRYLLFYNRKEQLTYTQNDKRMSYSVLTQLRFKTNGAVEKAEIHENPGASMYWYETSISFSDDNDPEWKVNQRIPVESLSDKSTTYYWKKASKQWVLQEAQP
ncbi:MAG: hypothetical protein U0V74_16825 [Chitinophagales bacterium]